ncbi:MAG: hypothetical protein M5U34_02365 [Chloroflexi bacterium]|nr:hypothetical protein [Chloroflexota bacterium]
MIIHLPPRQRASAQPLFVWADCIDCHRCFLLLVNLGVIQGYSFNWTAVFQLWLLFLILIGVNIIVKQRRSLGRFSERFSGIGGDRHLW